MEIYRWNSFTWLKCIYTLLLFSFHPILYMQMKQKKRVIESKCFTIYCVNLSIFIIVVGKWEVKKRIIWKKCQDRVTEWENRRPVATKPKVRSTLRLYISTCRMRVSDKIYFHILLLSIFKSATSLSCKTHQYNTEDRPIVNFYKVKQRSDTYCKVLHFSVELIFTDFAVKNLLWKIIPGKKNHTLEEVLMKCNLVRLMGFARRKLGRLAKVTFQKGKWGF